MWGSGKKGELIIDGVMGILNDAQEIGEVIPVGADGDIWAKVTENYHQAYPFLQESRNYGRALQKSPFPSEITGFHLEKILMTVKIRYPMII